MIKIFQNIAILGLIFCSLLFGQLVPAQAIENQVSYSEKQNLLTNENLLVLQINLGDLVILDGQIIGYKIDDDIFLSLRDLVRILEFPIIFSADNMSAKGWFIDESKVFNLDLNQHQSEIAGKKLSILPQDLILSNNDIFVNSAILQKWFGLNAEFDHHNQELNLNSGGLLPIEMRLERQQQWQKLATHKEDPGEEIKDLINTPYKLAAVPFGDLSYRQNYANFNGQPNSSSQINGLFTGDFLYLNNQISISAQDSSITNARITSGRRDDNGKLLGPLGATEFSFGDIYTPELPLIAQSNAGSGAVISNYPLQYVNQFNRTNIRGNAQINWDVELYRNDSLFNVQKVGLNGIYEFIDVPLVSGLNIIKLIFYGPFGQQYQEIRQFIVSNDLLKAGKIYYRFVANKNNQNLIQTSDQNSADNTNNQNQGADRLFGEIGYGLTKSTSIVASLAKVPINFSDQSNEYSALSLRSSLLGVFGRFDLARDLKNQSNSQELSLQTAFFNYSLAAVIDNFDKNFISEQNQPVSNPLLKSILVRLDGPLTLPLMKFPSRISLSTTREDFLSGEFRNNTQADLSLGLSSKLSLTQNLSHNLNSTIQGENQRSLLGRTLFNYLFSPQLNARSGFAYNIQPDQKLTTANFSINYYFSNTLGGNFNIDHQFSQDLPADQTTANIQDLQSLATNIKESTNYSASISKTFDKLIFSFGGNYIDEGNYGINLNLSTSFGYDAKNNTGVISGIPIASGGAVIVKVFIDSNQNGIFDQNEEPLKNIEMLLNDGVKKLKSDKNGTVFWTNLKTDIASKISLNSDSLPDPYLLPNKKAVKVFSHSGTISEVNFPIIQVGAISGFISLNKNNFVKEPAANVELQLIDKKTGNIIATTKSSYDGFYLLEMIPFGSYQLKLSEEQSQRLGIILKKPYEIDLKDNNQNVDKVNFTINYQEKLAPADSKRLKRSSLP